jgi:Tol biopolymer transport system component
MLPPGTRFGAYEVVAPLGSGGMGEVYRARDTRLQRDVALKVLAPSVAADPSHLARFEQEARHVAALSHPNIVALFDIGSDNGATYLVSELVDGATLRGASLPARKVTEIGAQIADALAAAHGAGVMHRDVKPDNVMLTRDGRAKLLDFGVAKLTGAAASAGVTIAQTGSHSVVGTPGYMAPEQVRGEAVDARTDIFATGALLHELLAGAPAFAGSSAVEVMAATLKADPAELPPAVPPGLREIVRRCLEKNPEERFQSARDLAFALRRLTGTSIGDATPRTSASRWSPSGLVIAAGALAIGVLATGVVMQRGNVAQNAAIDPIRLTRLTSDRRDEVAPAVSPDGRSLAYVREGGSITELLVRAFDRNEPVTLVRSNTALRAVVWSPDGNQVCYTDVTRIYSCVGAAGGTPRRLLPDAWKLRMAAPSGDAFFVRVLERQPWLFRSAAGAEPQRIGNAALSDPTEISPVSPDGTSLVVASGAERWLFSLPSGVRRRQWVSDPDVRTFSIAWLPDSRHIVAAEQTMGQAVYRVVVEDTQGTARRAVLHTTDFIDSIATTPDGARIVYAGGPVERDVLEYSADGKYLRTVAGSSMLEGFPAWAPAGDRFVYRAGGPGQTGALWSGGLPGTEPRLIQHLAGNSGSLLAVSPDGSRIVYADRAGVHVVSMSGGRSVRIFESSDVSRRICWSPDGESIWFSDTPSRVGRVSAAGGEPVWVDVPAGPLFDCSPDGQWLGRLGRQGYVLTSTDGKTERLIAESGAYATGGESVAQFGEGGTRVYFLNADRRTIDVLDLATSQRVRTITFDIPLEDRIWGFAFSPDGTRVLLTTGGDRTDLWMVEGFARPATSWSRWFAHWESPPRRDATP